MAIFKSSDPLVPICEGIETKLGDVLPVAGLGPKLVPICEGIETKLIVGSLCEVVESEASAHL